MKGPPGAIRAAHLLSLGRVQYFSRITLQGTSDAGHISENGVLVFNYRRYCWRTHGNEGAKKIN
jgi:hypothetical protein